jgi:hypothetical protein
MRDLSFVPDPQYALNWCTKYLARHNTEARHAFTPDARDTSTGTICEAWRFPVIDTYRGGAGSLTDASAFPFYNQVTFVYRESTASPANAVSVIGTFHNLYEELPLTRVPFGDTTMPFWALSFAVPKRQVHRYRFVVDGIYLNDPINPQTTTLPTGKTWSRFFTEECAENLVLEDWEQSILDRLVEQLAPFRTSDGQRFLDQFYTSLDNSSKQTNFEHAYRFDQSVGEVAFIDNVLAREEHHRLPDYKICLSLIDGILRKRNPYEEPSGISKEIYAALYDEMATDKVDGWDTSKYQSPLFFLNLLRRHACTGSFSHPKYGGNAAAAGWTYLEDRYRKVPDGTSFFNWREAIERPLGRSADYLG